MKAFRLRRHRFACRQAVAGALVCAGAASIGSVRAQEPARPPELQAPSIAVRGQLASRYVLRWNGNTHDNDLYETLSLDIGREESDAVTGHLYGRLAADLDGSRDGSSPYFSLQDTRSGGVDAQLYDAYADLHRIDGVDALRLGRQTIYDTPETAFFDGVHVRTAPTAAGAIQVGGYGGVSTHLYESSSDGDWTLGLYGECRPWDGGRLRLDWMYLEDEALLGEHEDSLFSGGVWHTIGNVQLEAQYSRIENRDRDVRARGVWTLPEERFTGQITWYQLLTTQRSQVLEADPFFQSLHELFPFWQLSAMVGKGVVEHIDVDLGADVRRVADDGDIGTFNHDYERWYVNVNGRDLIADALTITLTADLWHAEGQDVETWAGEISQEYDDLWTLSAGSYYSLYKFTLFANDERDHVRTYYAKVRYEASHAADFDLAYEFERTDLDDFQVLRMGFTWRF